MGSRVLREASAFNNKLIFTAMAVFALLLQPVYAIVVGQTAAAAAPGVVTNVNPDGWDWGGWSSPAGIHGSATIAANTATGGNAALQLTTPANESYIWTIKDVAEPLSGISSLSYMSQRVAGPAHAAPGLLLYIDADGDVATNDGFYIFYEPVYNYSTASTNYDNWNTWAIDAATSKFWSWTVIGGLGGANGANMFTLDHIKTTYPSALVTTYRLNMGTGNTGWQAWADKIMVNDTLIADFELATIEPCVATTNVHSTDLTQWDLSETRATGHNEITADGLRIWTEGNSSTDKAAGYYATDFALQNLGSDTIADVLTYTANDGSTAPGAQLVVDFDGDGTPDGILVGESIYGNNWWLTNGSAQFAKDGAPQTGGGNGSDWFGTASQWLNAFPGARVKAIGYSLGSGVKGDYTITKISAGCVDYTFGLPEEEIEEPELPAGGLGGESVQTTTTTTTEETVVVTTMMPATTDVAEEETDKAVDSTSEEADVAGEQDAEKTWSLVNVLLAIATTILSVVAVLGLRKGDEDSKLIRLLTIVPAVGAIGIVLWVEDFTAKLGWFNTWTILLAVIVIAQVVLYVNSNVAEEE